MRKMRQDEIDLINRVRTLNVETERTIKALTVDKDERSNRGFRKGEAVYHNEWPHPDVPPVVSPRCQCTLVPEADLAQEGTIEQIRRMVKFLPVTDHCEHYDHKCLQMHNIVISAWARDFLKQMIKEKEGS